MVSDVLEWMRENIAEWALTWVEVNWGWKNVAAVIVVLLVMWFVITHATGGRS